MIQSKYIITLVALAALIYQFRDKLQGVMASAGLAGVNGIELNNPGLIRIEMQEQVGELTPSKHEEYATFMGASAGVFALARKLRRFGESVLPLRQFITAWANYRGADATSYVAAVSDATGIDPDTIPQGMLKPIMKAIIQRENGVMPYSDLVLQQGVNMLLVQGWE